MVRSIYCRKVKENGYLRYQPSREHRRRTRGGGVATVIACSKPEALDDYEIDHSSNPSPYGRIGTWFRLWSDGFIEQGITTRDHWATSSTDNQACQFPIPFKDTNYTVNVTCSNYVSATGYKNKTQYSIIPVCGNDVQSDPTNYEMCVMASGFVSRETMNNILAGKIWTTGPYGSASYHEWINDPNA